MLLLPLCSSACLSFLISVATQIKGHRSSHYSGLEVQNKITRSKTLFQRLRQIYILANTFTRHKTLLQVLEQIYKYLQIFLEKCFGSCNLVFYFLFGFSCTPVLCSHPLPLLRMLCFTYCEFVCLFVGNITQKLMDRFALQVLHEVGLFFPIKFWRASGSGSGCASNDLLKDLENGGVWLLKTIG